jgi:hypothetical protein
MGQSNMAAGATVGSNHNSRSPDGEIVAGRGFWPGLCISLKHNSKFACFNIVAKGDYPVELRIPIPFSLISNDVSRDRLVVMPAYWFMYNMYAIARNSWKYQDRDKRTEKVQRLEYDFLAPDSIEEILDALKLMELYTAKAWLLKNEPTDTRRGEAADFDTDTRRGEAALMALGNDLLLNSNPELKDLEILAEGFENSRRKTVLVKVPQAYLLFRDLVAFHAVTQILDYFSSETSPDFHQFQNLLQTNPGRIAWYNVGGQFIPKEAITQFRADIRNGLISSWSEVHEFYQKQGEVYPHQKLLNALGAYSESTGKPLDQLDKPDLKRLLEEGIKTKTWMVEGIYKSRAKDYSNPFREMTYTSREEMEEVVGKLEDNSFILHERKNLEAFTIQVSELVKRL